MGLIIELTLDELLEKRKFYGGGSLSMTLEEEDEYTVSFFCEEGFLQETCYTDKETLKEYTDKINAEQL